MMYLVEPWVIVLMVWFQSRGFKSVIMAIFQGELEILCSLHVQGRQVQS